MCGHAVFLPLVLLYRGSQVGEARGLRASGLYVYTYDYQCFYFWRL
jgi:hypothetical protein